MKIQCVHLILSFENNSKTILVKIEVCGKNVKFLNISENIKENRKIFQNDFIFALISRHFLGLSRYFRLLKVMPQIKEHVSNEFNEIELKIQEIIFLQNLEFKFEFFVKI